jgi:hypothetical protein
MTKFNLLDYLHKAKSKVVCYYDGKSMLNGEQILCFLFLGNSANSKVGHSYYSVYVAKELNNDYHSESVCGDCSLISHCYTRGYMQMGYVNWIKKYLNGVIPLVSFQDLLDIRNILPNLFRFGMHGDPASMPFEKTEEILRVFRNIPIIGYTHQWSHPNFDKRYNIFLSSMEKEEQLSQVENNTARIIPDPSYKKKGEIICPHDLYLYMEAGHYPIKCQECQLCELGKKQNICFLPKKATGKFMEFLKN